MPRLVSTVHLPHPDTGLVVTLMAGVELPEWAVDVVHPSRLDDPAMLPAGPVVITGLPGDMSVADVLARLDTVPEDDRASVAAEIEAQEKAGKGRKTLLDALAGYQPAPGS